ncbi:helix-turn-helix domain-containing protein [Pseudonocardia sp. D17]|uniref:helix-turn-helix domain-containing protein n=1 Tax=Pseudonocardia sp. D17 TaxID=882661 RepID=UPI002B373C59|nr:hypothetical protein PSD17_55330 [Pseudonocardia sp. D17]
MAEPSAPTSYDELISVLESLPILVRETRRRRGMSQRAAAEQIGLETWATLSRCENGAGLHMKSIVPLLRWIGTPDAALAGSADDTREGTT